MCVESYYQTGLFCLVFSESTTTELYYQAVVDDDDDCSVVQVWTLLAN